MKDNSEKDAGIMDTAKSCKELSKTTEGKSYLYNNRCRKCQHFRKCGYV